MNMQEIGQTVEIKPRKVYIYNICLKKFDEKHNEIIFTVDCSKGTYIRSLCYDIAKALNTIGVLKELRRTRVGKFNITDAIKIEELKKNKENNMFIKSHFISFEKILEDKQVIKLTENEIDKYLNGVKLKKNFIDGIYRIKNINGVFLGIGEVKEGFLKRDVVI